MRQARKVKAYRRRQAASRIKVRAELAGNFLKKCDEVLWSLPGDYDCFLTCEEVEAVAALAREFGYYEENVQWLIDQHAKDDEDCENLHHKPCEYCRDSEGE